MKIGKKLKDARQAQGYSQEVLAEKLYVSRQTISNWENDKTYPDIESLLRISELFQVSLDDLVKGDVSHMKEKVSTQDRSQFEKLSHLFTLLFVLTLASPVFLFHYLDRLGFALWVALAFVTFAVSLMVEKEKKRHDIQTYREILAFMENRRLDDVEKIREEGKRPYQKIFAAMISGLVALVFALAIDFLFF